MTTSPLTPTATSTEPIQLVPDLAGCPYQAYARLREDGGVHRAVMAEGLPAWVVSGHSDVKALLADPRLSLNARTAGRGYPGFRLPPALNEHLLNVDEHDHDRIRRLISKAFTPRRIDALRARIQQVTDDLLDAMAEKGGRCDVLTELAVPLPIEVISDVLGIPARDGAAFRCFTSTLMDPSDQARAERPRVVGEMSDSAVARTTASARRSPGSRSAPLSGHCCVDSPTSRPYRLAARPVGSRTTASTPSPRCPSPWPRSPPSNGERHARQNSRRRSDIRPLFAVVALAAGRPGSIHGCVARAPCSWTGRNAHMGVKGR